MEVDSAILQQQQPIVAPGRPQQSRWLTVSILAGLTAVFVASVIFKPTAGEYFTVCGFKNFTGLPCPGCGLTHSFCALAKGDVRDAFAFNLVGPPLFLVFVFAWVRAAGVLLKRRGVVERIDGWAKQFNLVRAFAIAFLVYGVGRIVYLISTGPLNLHDSPLSQLIARLIH